MGSTLTPSRHAPQEQRLLLLGNATRRGEEQGTSFGMTRPDSSQFLGR